MPETAADQAIREEGERKAFPAIETIEGGRRRKGGRYPLSLLYEHFRLVRLTRLGRGPSWVKA
jgi:hypothetical protein